MPTQVSTQPLQKKQRTVNPPSRGLGMSSGSLLSVTLAEDEDVVWHWTVYPNEAPMKAKTSLVIEKIERVIYLVRGQRVMLDSDLAQLYGVTTKALNQAVKRNAERFPDDFAHQLTEQEVMGLRSQFVTSNPSRGGSRYRPWVFTEHGVAMLASVLKSPQAAKVNIEITRAFVHLRRLLATPGELISQINELAKTVNLHDEQISVVADVLKRMMDSPSVPKPKIGFRAELKSSSTNHEPSAKGARS